MTYEVSAAASESSRSLTPLSLEGLLLRLLVEEELLPAEEGREA